MTRIADLLADGPTVSFEFFPPKTPQAERNLEKVVAELAELEPSFVSVTYGALGSTRETTRDIVVAINRDQSFPAMAHLTCVGHTGADVAALLDEYHEAGVENILALGGDPPADGTDPGGEFEHAIELVEFTRDRHPFSVGVAAHPELHPRSPDRDSDRSHLARKLAVADFAITQFFFTVDDYARMVDELASLGCEKPVIPGVILFRDAAGLRRMAGMNNTHLPDELLDRVDEADDPQKVEDLAVDVGVELSQALLDEGAPGLHLYTLNRSSAPTRVLHELGLR